MGNSIKENYLLANGINTYYLEQGEGYPIILLHGGLSTAKLNWENHIPELAKNFHVVAPDCRGHGKSDNPSGKFSYEMMAEDIVELIQVLKLEKPLICGLSDGGQIAFELALNYPKLNKAIIVSGVLIEISEAYVDGFNQVGFMKPGVVNFEQLETAMKERIPIIKKAHSPVYGPDYWKTFIQELSKLWLDPNEYPGEKIKKIKMPVLNVHADHDFIPIEEAIKIYRLLPHSELAVAPNSQHSFPFSNWKLFLALISDFLERHGKDE
jgi:pimeloyl-ACP methyl ester carboxylesterase